MDITIPQTYEELNEQQRGVLCSILLTSSPFGGGGGRLPLRIIKTLISHLPNRTQQQLLQEVPFTALWQYAEPFLTTEKLYHFPPLTSPFGGGKGEVLLLKGYLLRSAFYCFSKSFNRAISSRYWAAFRKSRSLAAVSISLRVSFIFFSISLAVIYTA